MYKLIFAATFLTLLSGCQVEVVTEVKESYFEKGKGNDLASVLRAEVAGCADYSDSKKESRSLIEAKEVIPKVFVGAEYVECYRKDMNSWATFKMDIGIFRGKPEGDRAAIYRTENDFIGFYFPEKLDLRMKDAMSRRLAQLKPSFVVHYINDLDKPISVTIDDMYVEDAEGENAEPYLDQEITLKAGEDIYLRSSGILIDYLRKHETRAVIQYGK